MANTQSRLGHWTANNGQYPTAMTALAGLAMLAEGSTATQGKYAENLRRAIDYIVSRSRPNGLIGDPVRDNRYTYGHGFSLLFLSQVMGEEEDEDRRKTLLDVCTRAVQFSGEAQTQAGGWGYVSGKDGGERDEGSTTITQVQSLRGCRNAGIAVPKEVIDKAIGYIQRCTLPDGGVQYSSQGGGARPAITAAAICCLFNAGEYDNDFVPKLLDYCRKNLANINNQGFGHWHYAHYYYSQVMYREGGKEWAEYRDKINAKIANEQSPTAPGRRVMSDRSTPRPPTSRFCNWNSATCPSINADDLPTRTSQRDQRLVVQRSDKNQFTFRAARAQRQPVSTHLAIDALRTVTRNFA